MGARFIVGWLFDGAACSRQAVDQATGWLAWDAICSRNCCQEAMRDGILEAFG